MLDTTELRTLAQWCRGRGLRFLPLGAGPAGGAILFERLEPTRPWQRMKLMQGDDGFRLCDERDQLLASGSDLPAMLDALDGGVAEPDRVPARGRKQGQGALPPGPPPKASLWKPSVVWGAKGGYSDPARSE